MGSAQGQDSVFFLALPCFLHCCLQSELLQMLSVAKDDPPASALRVLGLRAWATHTCLYATLGMEPKVLHMPGKNPTLLTELQPQPW